MKFKKMSIIMMAVLLFSSSVYAAGGKSFSIFINDNKKELPMEQLMVVKNRVFVPLRFISENMGAVVGFDGKQKNVFITSNKIDRVRSSLHSKTNNTDFELKLLSNKTTYKYGEPIMIWSTLKSLTNQRLSIKHGTPLITYYLEDADGFKLSEMKTSMAVNSEFNPGDEEIQVIPQQLFLEYHLHKNNITEVDKYLEEYMSSTTHPAALPKGKYTIGVSADYFIEQDRVELSTEVEIVVE